MSEVPLYPCSKAGVEEKGLQGYLECTKKRPSYDRPTAVQGHLTYKKTQPPRTLP